NLLTPKLLAIVLVLDIFVVFFAALTAFGLSVLTPAVAFGGGVAAIVLCILAAGLLRRGPIGAWLGSLIQLGLVATGFLLSPMFLVGAGSLLLWVWCLWRGAKTDRAPLPAAGGP